MNSLVFIPGSPALIPELSPSDAPSRRLLEAATEVISQALEGSRRHVHLVFSQDERWCTAHEGSFRAWGAPQVDVGKGYFLGELVARYILNQAGASNDAVLETRSNIAELNSDVLTVVVLDGSAGLTARAPLAEIETADEINEWCKRALQGRAADITADRLVAAGVVEPKLWLELAKLSPRYAELVDVDVSLGIGRFVARWEV